MTTVQTIPLNLLVASKSNVRRTGKTDGIGELAASIAAHGLRQNLNVQPAADGERFEVIAGGRRLRALKMLAKGGKLAEDAPVSCLVLQEGDDPKEISLVENTLREAMHPDDQFEAFRALIEDQGAGIEDVAARFGVSPAVVRQRLKLASVSPKLRAVFRKGDMELAHVMAFTVSDDHAAQEAAWNDLPEWNRDPDSIKAALTDSSIAMSDRLARFVTVEAYTEAGGGITRDLFDANNEGFLTDRALVMELVQAKLDREAESVRAEGWKWVKAEAVRDHSVYYDRLRGKLTAKAKARSGAIIRIDRDGALEIERGMIDPADAKAEARAAKRLQEGETAQPERSGYSAALVQDLTAHRTAALRVELSGNHRVALAMTVHALALALAYDGGADSCLDLCGSSDDLTRHVAVTGDSPAHKAMTEQAAYWGERLPAEAGDLMAWCLEQPQDTLLALLAYLAALTVDAVQIKQRLGHHDHAGQLAAALAFDMRPWWTPSVEGFYGRLPKAALAQAIAEAKVTADAPFDSVKKAEAAVLAAKALKDSGWFPPPLRSLS